MTAGTYTDEATGVSFKTWTATSGGAYTFGIALPSDALETDATEYIGYLVRAREKRRQQPLESITGCWRFLTDTPCRAANSPTPARPATAVCPMASPVR